MGIQLLRQRIEEYSLWRMGSTFAGLTSQTRVVYRPNSLFACTTVGIFKRISGHRLFHMV